MSVKEIDERAAAENRVFETAKAIRELLDRLTAEVELPDGRDAEEECLALVTG